MDWKFLFTSFGGRIGRQQWWLGYIVLMVVVAILITILTMVFGTPVPPEQMAEAGGIEYNLGPVGGTLMVVIMIAAMWFFLALTAKRWHDRNKSAWWILIGLVPIIGGIWALVENGFLKGTDGPNSYGPDPLGN